MLFLCEHEPIGRFSNCISAPLSVTIWFRNFVCFFKKRHHTAKTAWCWVPRDPNSIFFDYFYSINARKVRINVFLLFHVRKHMTSSFYLKCTEFTRNCEFCSNCGSLGIRTKLEQSHNIL